MDLLLLIKAAIMGVVEGLTEFLPVSSTGHLILTASLLDFNDARGKLFEIVIQSGAILAVVWEFRHRIVSTFARAPREAEARRLLVNVAVAFVP
ncbi:MAG TPA: undecaprenyl-diphosphate phosphatase, partial [Steroidobacteraceae bacterium]|nr:undecaprenyl-diphosphate phosphatase [Steroidobacteraceae bacterium]